MNNKFLTKKVFLFSSFLLLTGALIVYYFLPSLKCTFERPCIDLKDTALLYLLPVFLLSIFSYPLKVPVHKIWILFTLITIPLLIISSLFVSANQAMFGPSQRGIFMLETATAYIVISILILILSSLQVYKKKK